MRMIYKGYVDGYRGKLLSQETIVARLNGMGIPPPEKWQHGYEILGALVKLNSTARSTTF